MTPTDKLLDQIVTMQAAITVLQDAIDDITGSTNPETVSWADVSRYAHLIDGIRRGALLPEDQEV